MRKLHVGPCMLLALRENEAAMEVRMTAHESKLTHVSRYLAQNAAIWLADAV